MQLIYDDKIPEEQFLSIPYATTPSGDFRFTDKMLFQGDNIDVMKYLLAHGLAGKIDLVYIDPPFATDNVFTIGEDRVSTISRSKTDRVAYVDKLDGDKFIEFIRLRLILLRELLSEQGSIYLHIDCKIGHYVKIIMDEVFGQDKFCNDITRIKCNPKNFKRRAYGNIKDMILFYVKSKKSIWHEPCEPLEESDIVSRFSKKDKEGRYYTTVPLHAPGETRKGKTGGEWNGILPPKGRHWRCSPEELDKLEAQGLIEWSNTGNPRKIIYADERILKGKKVQDIWTYKDKPYPSYPTEKNIDLLNAIILASSDPGSLVLDCFCGSGTTLVAAENMDRNWIGIDQSEVAIAVTEKRLCAERNCLFRPPYQKIVFN